MTTATLRTKRDIEPSGRAFDAARKLAREAFKKDKWMTPCIEDTDIGDETDETQIMLNHRASWEQTEHWNQTWGKRLSQLTDQQEKRFLAPGDVELEWERRYYGLYQPLLETFWDTWDELYDTYGHIREAMKQEN